MGGPSPGGFVKMVLIMLIGHALNIAINLLGAFVHTSRLQYLEFFGKFFEDGGVPFDPVLPSEKYSAVASDEERQLMHSCPQLQRMRCRMNQRFQ